MSSGESLLRFHSRVPRRRCCQWPALYQALVLRVYPQIQAFQRARAEKRQISTSSKYDLVNREMTVYSNYDETHAAGDRLTIRHRKRQIALFFGDADLPENRLRQPGVIATSVDEKPGDPRAARSIG